MAFDDPLLRLGVAQGDARSTPCEARRLAGAASALLRGALDAAPRRRLVHSCERPRGLLYRYPSSLPCVCPHLVLVEIMDVGRPTLDGSTAGLASLRRLWGLQVLQKAGKPPTQEEAVCFDRE